MTAVLRWITAGESHGPALVAVLEGMVAGVEITTKELAAELARRKLGHGRSPRMAFEADELEVIGGIRHGRTQGGPVAVRIGNTEWPKWETVMAADPVDPELIANRARNAPLTRPRPGHADLAGMTKFGFDDARPVLERASARETAARVVLGTVAKAFLRQALDVEVVSHVVAIGAVDAPDDDPVPGPGDLERVDASPVRAFGEATAARMMAEIDAAHDDGDTLGGVIEVIAYGLPVGLGSYVQADRRLDARLAGALMSIQAMKGVEIGDGFRTAHRRGSVAHDEMVPADPNGTISPGQPAESPGLIPPVRRLSNRAGGLEGGMTNGEPVRVRVAMKPISTVPRALRTVDVATGEEAVAIHQRSDACAVPRAGVVAEAVVALVLADATLEKFGGDALAETRRNARAYRDGHLRSGGTGG
jgi:chorismate synthase